MDGSIVRLVRGVVTEEVVARGSAASFWGTEVGAFRMDAIDHITGNIVDQCIRVGCSIVE